MSSSSLPAARGVGAEARLGLRLFLASLSMLFGGSLVALLVVRLRATNWRPPNGGELLAELWLSTFLIAVVSVILALAVRAARAGAARATAGWLIAAMHFGVGFVLNQAQVWARMWELGIEPRGSLFAFGFLVLTALHAAHVVGGLAPLAVTTWRAARAAGATVGPDGLDLLATYWHFLFGSWLAVFAALSI